MDMSREDVGHFVRFIRTLPQSLCVIVFGFRTCSRLYNYISDAWDTCAVLLGNLPNLERIELRVRCRQCYGARSLAGTLSHQALANGMPHVLCCRAALAYSNAIVAVTCIQDNDILHPAY